MIRKETTGKHADKSTGYWMNWYETFDNFDKKTLIRNLIIVWTEELDIVCASISYRGGEENEITTLIQ